MDNKEKNRLAALTISFFRKISPLNYKKLINIFPQINDIFTCDHSCIKKIGIRVDIIDELISFKKNLDIEEVIERMNKENIKFVCSFEKEYPAHLKEIPDPPIVLYYKGEINPWPKHCLSIVGARKHSLYGERVLKEIIPSIINYNICTISGLALGIDTIVHQETINNKGKTFAVLGAGLDRKNLYPKENIYLANVIIELGGAIISEFPPGTPPTKYGFPQRNRIISGLAKAVLIIEAKEKSGSLITASHAIDQNREVAAIPGNIFSEFSAGTNQLISLGAKLISNANDLIEYFSDINTDKQNYK